MPLFIAVFILFLPYLAVHGLSCPNSSFELLNEEICVYFSNDAAEYSVAVTKCAQLNGIPAKIQNAFENNFIGFMLTSIANLDIPFYIGVEKNSQNTWTYADGSTLKFATWDTGEPNTAGGSCGIMTLRSEKWNASDCTIKRPFLCTLDGNAISTLTSTTTTITASTITATYITTKATTTTYIESTTTTLKSTPITTAYDGPCPVGWVYFNLTQACYYLQNATLVNGINVWNMYSWQDAKSNCNTMNSNLISIHSKAENDFVYDLLTTYVKNTPSIGMCADVCVCQWAWIGLYGNGGIGNGYWVDGTEVDYTDWHDEITSNETMWAASNDPSCGYRQWTPSPWKTPFPNYTSRFVCQQPAKNLLGEP